MKGIQKYITYVVAGIFIPLIGLFAGTMTENGVTWRYQISNNAVEITGVDGSALGALIIPSTIEGLPVVSIGDRAFQYCEKLTSIAIPSSVTSIGDGAFFCSGSREKVHICDIAKWCNIYFGDSYSNPIYYGSDLYLNGEKIVDLVIPNGVTNIAPYAFYSCKSIASITMPDSLISIGEDAFYDCSGITSIMIPGNVTVIGDNAFSGCSSLNSVYIPTGCTVDKFSFVGKHIVRYKPRIFVSLDTNGGCLEQTIFERQFHSVYGTMPIPSRIGFVFNGWYFNGERVSDETKVEALDDHILIAQWTPNRYQITFDANGGDGGISGEQDYDSAIVTPTVTRAGYTFTGWSPSVPSTVPATDVTYTAQWRINKYTVTFDANGGEGGTIVQQDYGSSIVVPEVMRVGYTFVGWDSSVSATVPASDVIYTAQWRINKYSVTFDANGGVGGTSVLQDYDSVIVAPDVTRIGYTFIGWAPTVATTVPASDVNYVAQWKINRYTVSFDANGGEGSIADEWEYGSSLLLPVVIRDGYRFLGWFSESEGGEEISDGKTVTGEMTIYAHWQKVWNVTFDVNGSEHENPPSIVIDDESMIGELPILTFEGYAFAGWWTDKEGGEIVSAETIVTSDTVLYARWEQYIVPEPVISSSSGMEFYDDFSVVSIDCTMEGALIYYSDEGKTPKLNDTYLYRGAFTVTNTVTVKAVAVFEGVKSDYVTVTIEKKVRTIEDALDLNDGVRISFDESAPWIIDVDNSKTGDCSVKSRDVEDGEETWMTATVTGGGTLSFWCKVDCEHDDDNTFTWDRLMVCTNGVEIKEWRMDGESDWVERTIAFAGGENTITWYYWKDESDSSGEDCVWVDGVRWEPAELTVDVGGANVTVPVEWIDSHADIVAAAGGDKAAALLRTAANGRKVWECFMLGVDPTKADDDFKITRFWMEGGKPKFEFSHSTDGAGNSFVPRLKVKGKAELADGWSDVPEGGNSTFRFFTVEVELP